MNNSRPSETGPVLRVDEVDVVREGRALLRRISVTVQRGEHWAVLGPNGAGKSTLLRLLGAQWHPTRGTVEVLAQHHPDLATVLVTHHLEEIPGVATHALLLRQGDCCAAGPIDDVVTSAAVSHCFDHPLTVQRSSGRWSVRSGAQRAPTRV